MGIVNNPQHYNNGKVEIIDCIESIVSGHGEKAYLVGNIVKYLARAPHKGNYEQDLRKAKWYLNRLMEEE